jgi:hypothetical protein
MNKGILAELLLANTDEYLVIDMGFGIWKTKLFL